MEPRNDFRVKIATDDIIKYFDSLEQKIFKKIEIANILKSERSFWRLTHTFSVNEFLQYLLFKTKLQEKKFMFPYRTETRYTWGDVSLYEILLSLKKNTYFTHYTAVYFHNLTEQIPKSIFLNFEQPPKPKVPSSLEQGRIDSAFKRKMRKTKNIAEYSMYKIHLLNGMFTDNLGVIDFESVNGDMIRLTNIERTLIDITVRPEYSGGVHEVLKIFKNSKDKVSINKLTATLKKLNYVYPYYQAIGFYLERSGVYSDKQIALLKDFEMEFDFYLSYNMQETDYSKEWKLFIPKGF